MYTSSVIFPWCNFAWNNATRKLPGIATENFDDTVVGPTVIYPRNSHGIIFRVLLFFTLSRARMLTWLALLKS